VYFHHLQITISLHANIDFHYLVVQMLNNGFPFYLDGNLFFLIFGGCVLNVFDSIGFGCGVMDDFFFFFFSKVIFGNMYFMAPFQKVMFSISSI
jgi:hypothetical protein